MSDRHELTACKPETGAFARRMLRDFDSFFDGRGASSPELSRFGLDDLPWSPEIELAERDQQLYARFDLPGMKKDEIAVTVGDGTVTVSGERKKKTEDATSAFFKSERAYGAFARTIPIPHGVTPADITATFAHGVLELAMPSPRVPVATPVKLAITEPR